MKGKEWGRADFPPGLAERNLKLRGNDVGGVRVNDERVNAQGKNLNSKGDGGR